MPMNQSKLTAIIGVGEPGKSQIFVRTVETLSWWGSNWQPVWGQRVKKPSVWATVFQVFSTTQGKTKAKPFKFLSFLLLGYTIAAITHKRQASTCGWVLALGHWQTSRALKQWTRRKSDVHAKSKNPVSTKLPLTVRVTKSIKETIQRDWESAAI